MSEEKNKFQLRILKEHYSFLSQLTELFSRESKHKVFIKINEMMNKILREIDEIEEPQFIKTTNEFPLIAVHLNISRSDKYFYEWDESLNGWVRTKEIPDNLKKLYKSPLIRSNYK